MPTIKNKTTGEYLQFKRLEDAQKVLEQWEGWELSNPPPSPPSSGFPLLRRAPPLWLAGCTSLSE